MAYQPFDTQSILEYAKTFTGIFPVDAKLSCEEIGDGNLNLVFRVKDQYGHSLIFKQALPYARVVGESWPLTIDRNRIEASALRRQFEFVPNLVPQIFAYNEEQATTVMEDLSSYTVFRTALVNGFRGHVVFKHLGEFLAKTLFYTSDLSMDAGEKKQDVQRFTNPQLCRITELLIFTDPFYDAETNAIPEELWNDVRKLWQDAELKSAVAKLKWKFMTKAEALLHGDLHTGSIMVREEDLKVFDPEFAYYGPMGFDIGLLIGNILLNFAANYPGVKTAEDANYWLSAIQITWDTFYDTFHGLWKNHVTDPMFQDESFRDHFLENVLRDTIGFAGTEMIRRTIGLAHVMDLDGMEEPEQRIHARRFALEFGAWLVKTAPTASSIKLIEQGIIQFIANLK